MSTQSSKAGIPISLRDTGEVDVEELSGAPRRWTLRERLSALFSQLESGNRAAAAARFADRADRDMTGRRFVREALRQRLMPTAATVAGAEWSASSLTDLSSMEVIPDP